MMTTYDEVAYPTHAFRQTCPDRLATHAMLFGLPHAPIENCRVLDIGAGDGGNIIPMAVNLPNARFVGYDLSQVAVERGVAMIAMLGLRNIELVVDDIMNADFGSGSFDYIIAHGVYSWVPEPVRNALLTSIRRHLAPNGVAFVSYNAMPGGRIRQALRDRLLFAVRDVQGAQARTDGARAFLPELIGSLSREDPFQVLLLVEAQRLFERPADVLAHDELGETYHPVHFHEFRSHAEDCGLRFLTEAEASRCGEGFAPPYARNDPDFDVLAHAQDMDFQDVRFFRQSLLVHDAVEISRISRPERLFGMHVSSNAYRNKDGAFQVGASQVDITDAALAGALDTICGAWPATIPVSSLIDDEERAAALLRMYWVGVVELHAEASSFPTVAGKRPNASRFARAQAAAGQTLLTTLIHGAVEVTDPFSLSFIAGLDGSRTREQIAKDIAPVVGGTPDSVLAQIETQLTALARMPLLVG